MQIEGVRFVPFVLGVPRLVAPWVQRSPLADTRLIDVLAPASAPFFDLLLRGNALAFGAASMPGWVQLDCATLPSAMIGFALARADVPAGLAARLGDLPVDSDALVPVCEFCAALTPEPGTVSAFSLFSLLPGLRLGVRAKALALLLMDARRQMGVTRREGPVRRTHELFGPLRVLADRTVVHPAAEDTMIYELDVPPAAVLEALVRTGARPPIDA
ncbi:MAG: hypothetical protein O2894_13840 [Planctomycetota bacterium]|nr:hypothetical protein [Planctomycetota bacterium]